MTTVAHEIDGTPTALSGLSAGTAYYVESVLGTVMLAEAAEAPGADSVDALVLREGRGLYLTLRAGTAFYAWCPGGSGRLVTVEAE